jgi:hypothetical protein
MSEVFVFHTRIGKGNRIGLPAPVCQTYGLEPGTKVTVSIGEHGVHVTTDQQALKLAQELFTRYIKPGETPSVDLLRERREEATRE